MRHATIALFLLAAAAPGEPLIPFLRSLLTEHASALETVLQSQVGELCDGTPIDTDARANHDSLYPLLFLHALLTTDAAIDCAKAGVLGTVYFWHWTTPNPRHDILRLPDSVKLTTVAPPKGYGRYKSHADLDRLPTLYLSDLVTATPTYYHPGCNSFHTFGWCSEREMAFNALLANMGYACKVKQDGIHVWTEVLVMLRHRDEASGLYIIRIDNTFAQSVLRKLKVSRERWATDFGSGAQVAWYNRKAHSSEERAGVAAIDVSPRAARRIRAAVRSWCDAEGCIGRSGE